MELIKEANSEFAKEFLKRLILIKLKQDYRNNQPSLDLEAEKFEKALRELEEKSKEKRMIEFREQIKEKAIVKSTEVNPQKEIANVKTEEIESKQIPPIQPKPLITELKPIEHQLPVQSKPTTEQKPIQPEKPAELTKTPIVHEIASKTLPAQMQQSPQQQLPPQQLMQPRIVPTLQPRMIPPTQPAPVQKVAITPAPPTQAAPIVSLEKIYPLLKDPTIQSIECSGENKPLTINKFGAIQTTNISLSKEEIDAILKELSEKTRIPLTTGMFKVAYGPIILTATISEFVGTRFIIRRKEFA